MLANRRKQAGIRTEASQGRFNPFYIPEMCGLAKSIDGAVFRIPIGGGGLFGGISAIVCRPPAAALPGLGLYLALERVNPRGGKLQPHGWSWARLAVLFACLVACLLAGVLAASGGTVSEPPESPSSCRSAGTTVRSCVRWSLPRRIVEQYRPEGHGRTQPAPVAAASRWHRSRRPAPDGYTLA